MFRSEMTATAADVAGLGSVLADYLDDVQLARELGVCDRTLHRWRRLGDAPPSVMIGRKRLTRRDAIANWLRSRETGAPP